RLLPTHSFARCRPRSPGAAPPAGAPSGRGFIWREFLAVRATPFNASCGRASAIAGARRRIHGHIRVGPNGRDLELPQGNPDRTTGRTLLHRVPFPVKPRDGYNAVGLGGG